MIRKTINFSEIWNAGNFKNNKACYRFGIRVILFLKKRNLNTDRTQQNEPFYRVDNGFRLVKALFTAFEIDV